MNPETETDGAPAPFTMFGAGPGMVCEGDVCVVPGFGAPVVEPREQRGPVGATPGR